MESEIFNTRTLEFTTPSGHVVTIREQNGADDDILSNPVEASSLMNLSRFISGIILKSDYTTTNGGRLTAEQVHHLPSLDRYCILFNSRIFSLGETLEFEYDWGEEKGGKVNYEQDLREFLFDYSQTPSAEEMEAKPNAIPFYPERGKTKDIVFTTASGKELVFDLLTPAKEAWVTNLPMEKQTRNVVYMARNLRLKVGEKLEIVNNFSVFSPRDMVEIRNNVLGNDPTFMGITSIKNPTTSEEAMVSLVALPGFFYLGEI